MNTSPLKAASVNGGPMVLGGGMMLLAIALVGAGHFRPEAAAPHPTVTATVTAPAPEPARTTVVTRPGASTTPTGVVPVSDVTAGMPHTGSGGLSHGQARPPSAPKPTPTPHPPAAANSSCAIGLTVSVLDACVSLGGGR